MSSIRCFIKATENEYEIKGGINGIAGRLYFDLMDSVTQKDWCWYELEMSKSDMIKFLSQEKYKQERHSSIIKHTFPDGSVYEYDLCENAFIEEALDFVNNLSGREDCILVAYDEG